MKLPKWFTIANISKGPEPLTVELVDLTEKIVQCFLTDDYHYKLTVKIGGRKVVIKHVTITGHLKYSGYMEMLTKALGGQTLYKLQQKGYEIIVHDTFYDSLARKRILRDVQMAKKVVWDIR